MFAHVLAIVYVAFTALLILTFARSGSCRSATNTLCDTTVDVLPTLDYSC
jgi:hypothetical protein